MLDTTKLAVAVVTVGAIQPLASVTSSATTEETAVVISTLYVTEVGEDFTLNLKGNVPVYKG